MDKPDSSTQKRRRRRSSKSRRPTQKRSSLSKSITPTETPEEETAEENAKHILVLPERAEFSQDQTAATDSSSTGKKGKKNRRRKRRMTALDKKMSLLLKRPSRVSQMPQPTRKLRKTYTANSSDAPATPTPHKLPPPRELKALFSTINSINCGGCYAHMDGGRAILTDEGIRYHLSCFRCGTCGISLVGSPCVVRLQSRLMCAACSARFAPVCAACRRSIRDSEFLYLAPNYYHADHLTCQGCGNPKIVSRGMLTFGGGGGPLCAYCALVSRDLVCCACGRLIADRFLRQGERRWHVGCFACATCKSKAPLGTLRISAMSGLLACQECCKRTSLAARLTLAIAMPAVAALIESDPSAYNVSTKMPIVQTGCDFDQPQQLCDQLCGIQGLQPQQRQERALQLAQRDGQHMADQMIMIQEMQWKQKMMRERHQAQQEQHALLSEQMALQSKLQEQLEKQKKLEQQIDEQRRNMMEAELTAIQAEESRRQLEEQQHILESKMRRESQRRHSVRSNRGAERRRRPEPEVRRSIRRESELRHSVRSQRDAEHRRRSEPGIRRSIRRG